MINKKNFISAKRYKTITKALRVTVLVTLCNGKGVTGFYFKNHCVIMLF